MSSSTAPLNSAAADKPPEVQSAQNLQPTFVNLSYSSLVAVLTRLPRPFRPSRPTNTQLKLSRPPASTAVSCLPAQSLRRMTTAEPPRSRAPVTHPRPRPRPRPRAPTV
ncbi:hypothetical protein XA68_10956 [Ophiocordyceps unilateralis]|uniref:Uncharacterized protein n=1 Tax=Ophiocordyceps unilateralis TaxID=268505 RepID=A0A2A9P2C7_OPHUN|nr:hypothetical protein XA68_10956 [Ophiocordyceps unilateralis]